MSTPFQDLDLGIIGNGSIAALIDPRGTIRWLCLPRFDGAPVFNALMGGQGEFSIWAEGLVSQSQFYDKNSAVLRTQIECQDGSAFEIIDFTPRFRRRGRIFRPATIVRRIRVLKGEPLISVRMTPQEGWSDTPLLPTRGINHLSYQVDDVAFRLTTDAPISYVLNETPFLLDRDMTFILGADESLSDSAGYLAQDWQARTVSYWQHWVRGLHVPFEWQEAVIRAAITLKMCVYEETGGIVAALTTSIPEHEGSERNWDYRYCWIRDAYFSVTALNRLSAMGTLEHYMRWVRNIVAHAKGGHVQPVYGIGTEADLTEWIAESLSGFKGHKPVRVGNQAAEHIQHDVYGQIVLGVSQSFFDDRLLSNPGIAEFHQLEPVGERAFAMHDQPDAGIWEFRSFAQVHTSSAMMCWAACNRLYKIANHLGLDDRASYWDERAKIIRAYLLEQAWNPDVGAFTAAYGGTELDASVLLMAEIGLIDPNDQRYVKTVEAIDRDLRVDGHVYRYKIKDDFGVPKTAFTACTFWLIDALHRIGQTEQARSLFENILASRNNLGLLSEDIDTQTNQLWGNYPQTYCMVGIINSATLLSQDWSSNV